MDDKTNSETIFFSEHALKKKFPPWIRVRAVCGTDRKLVEDTLEGLGLNTVCRSAGCPNLGECWGCGTATFMILGDRCTRRCGFCGVGHSPAPPPPDSSESARIAEASFRLKLKHVVITSVTRDDLGDGGASFFAESIREIRGRNPGASVEVLTPDFKGDGTALKKVIDAGPDVFNHNLETVERLSRKIRGGADYRRSLKVLETAFNLSAGKTAVKSGLMAGMGETDDELLAAVRDIRRTGASALTIGQYLPPGRGHWPLHRFVEPDTFKKWKAFAEALGFKSVASAPLVRSSYKAEKV